MGKVAKKRFWKNNMHLAEDKSTVVFEASLKCSRGIHERLY